MACSHKAARQNAFGAFCQAVRVNEFECLAELLECVHGGKSLMRAFRLGLGNVHLPFLTPSRLEFYGDLCRWYIITINGNNRILMPIGDTFCRKSGDLRRGNREKHTLNFVIQKVYKKFIISKRAFLLVFFVVIIVLAGWYQVSGESNSTSKFYLP